jgi:hypothetical protein
MRHAIVQGGIVVNVVLAEPEFAAEQGWVLAPDEVSTGWLYDGSTFSPPLPIVRDPAEIQAEIEAAVQTRLDDFAATRYYNGILSACTYATSAVPRFKTEGQYCVEARDATWAQCYEILTAVQAGTRPMPSGYADIEGELPVLAWPN